MGNIITQMMGELDLSGGSIIAMGNFIYEGFLQWGYPNSYIDGL
jgi:hypothetical protein